MGNNKWQYIYQFFGENFVRLGLTIFCGIIANATIILIPISLGKYFDLFFGFQSHRAFFLDLLPFNFWNSIPQYLYFLGGVIILSAIFQFLQRYQTGILGEFFVKDLREKLFNQQLQISTSVYEDRGTGRYLLRHSGDLKSIQNYLTKGIIRFITDSLLILFALIILLWLNKIIFLIILSGFVLTAITVYFLNQILFNVSEKRRNTRSGILSFVSRQLRANKSIKAFNKVPTEMGKYTKRSEDLYSDGKSFQAIYNLIFSSTPALLYLTLLAVLHFIYVAKEQVSDSINTAELLGFIFLFITILPIFRRLIRVMTVWELGNISFEKLKHVFDLSIEKRANKGKLYAYKKGHIEFRKVRFAYDGNYDVFKNLNIEILPLTNNQIKIGNGEGKSTFIKLMAGLYYPNSGNILYDGQLIKKINLSSLRRKITFISDEFPLLGRSVFEVISYSRKEEKKENAQLILDLFQQNIPNHLKLELSDKIAEGCENLAKSQIKMLQYIRAALSDKPIIIIDEPIRNLEKQTKKNVLNWLNMQTHNKTVVLLCRNWKKTNLPIFNSIQINNNVPEKIISPN